MIAVSGRIVWLIHVNQCTFNELPGLEQVLAKLLYCEYMLSLLYSWEICYAFTNTLI